MSDVWSVELTASAYRDLRRLESGVRHSAVEALLDLSEDPAPPAAIELRGATGVWRVRFHNDRYRIVYRVAKNRKRIIVMRVRARASAYEGLAD